MSILFDRWQIFPASLPDGINYYERGFIFDEISQTVFVCMLEYIDGPTRCSYSKDVGVTWESIDNNVANINFLHKETQELFGLSQNGQAIMFSNDLGDSWYSINNDYFEEGTFIRLDRNGEEEGAEQTVTSRYRERTSLVPATGVSDGVTFDGDSGTASAPVGTNAQAGDMTSDSNSVATQSSLSTAGADGATTIGKLATTEEMMASTEEIVATTEEMVATTKEMIATTKKMMVTTEGMVATTEERWRPPKRR
ncbi:hypothetical protein BSL78_06814 [Apostichopus japonicus]|uniref:Uncharacterized protein n=1 Tax=Stichopus japonicus TaxID=307972 RepID=A0A2G8L7R9_STIJA|nr:hypothetical protein BSL78_06814 [Apostichopus japonicus]